MASIIEGYTYDIFISYRQKDNKYDGWVTEFVDNLKRELEATFKEDLSIYFDENPHDGLLETHSVDKSLEGKLKCLIFIPVISQTYCDSKCFAWQQEFCVFNKLAKEDKFRRDLRLASGNVASRILPIKIHDLDPEDKTLLENEIGGVLRCLEFIYKSPGVNRPLRANEDHPHDNLNKTYYRDQINKVANAVKEIIAALKKQSQYPEEVSKQGFEVKPVQQKNLKTKIIAGILILFTLIVIGYLFIPELFNPSGQLEKSIAVLPFENWNSDDEYMHLGDAITDEIILQLQYINDFDRVLSRSSTMQFKENRPTIPEIAEKLGVNYIIEGSIQRQKDSVTIRVQVLRAKNEDHIWGEKYDRKWEDIFFIQDDIAKKVAKELRIVLTPLEIKRVEKKPTENLEAYNLYLLGRSYYNRHVKESIHQGIKYFNSAIQLDSTLAFAYVSLAQSYQFMVRYSWMPREEGQKKAKEAILKAIELDDSLGEAHAALGLIMIVFDLDIYGPEQEFQKAIKLSPNSAEVFSSYAQYLRWIGRYDQGLNIAKRATELDPLTTLTSAWPGILYLLAGRYDESIEYLKKYDLNFWGTNLYLAYNYYFKGMFSEAIFYADKTISLIGNISNDPSTSCCIGWVYAKSGEINKAREILTQAMVLNVHTSVDPVVIAAIYDGLGEYEKVFDWLLKAYEVRSGQIIYLKAYSDLYFKDISSDPRYIDLLKKIGFKVN